MAIKYLWKLKTKLMKEITFSDNVMYLRRVKYRALSDTYFWIDGHKRVIISGNTLWSSDHRRNQEVTPGFKTWREKRLLNRKEYSHMRLTGRVRDIQCFWLIIDWLYGVSLEWTDIHWCKKNMCWQSK